MEQSITVEVCTRKQVRVEGQVRTSSSDAANRIRIQHMAPCILRLILVCSTVGELSRGRCSRDQGL